MAKNKGFSFYENFWTSVQALPLEQQKDVFYAIAKYGITGEDVDPGENPIGFTMTQALKPSLDKSIEVFNSNKENGSKGGRPSKIDGEKLQELISRGYTAQKIADELGVSKSAVEKNEIWKNRKNVITKIAKTTETHTFNF